MSVLSSFDQLKKERDLEVEDAKRFLGRFSDVRLSYWKFQNYKTCPQKFALMTVRKPEPRIRDNYYAIRGSVIHTIWENFINEVKTERKTWNDSGFLMDNIEPVYDEFIDTEPVYWAQHATTEDLFKKESLPEIERSMSFLYRALRQEGLIPRDPTTIHTEYHFETKLTPSVTIAGRTDLVFENANDLEVVDLKDVIRKSNVDWRQLVWYAIGIEPHFKKRVRRAGFLLTQLEDWSWRNPDARNYRKDLTVEILETALHIRRDAFNARVNRHTCSYCDVASKCPEWSQYSRRSDEILSMISVMGEGNVEI